MSQPQLQRLDKLEAAAVTNTDALPLFVYFQKSDWQTDGIEPGESLGDYCKRVGRPLPLPEQHQIYVTYCDPPLLEQDQIFVSYGLPDDQPEKSPHKPALGLTEALPEVVEDDQIDWS